MDSCPDVARREIERLQGQGYELSLHEIVWLASLGEKVEKPGGRVNPYLEMMPVTAGNVTLYPLTIQATLFLDAVIDMDWVSEARYTYFLGWLSANARTPGAFDGITSKTGLEKVVDKWCKTVTATSNELADAVSRIIDDDSPDAPEERAETDYRKYLANLEAASGQSQSEWMTRTMGEANAVTYAAAELRHGEQQDEAKVESREAYRTLLRAVKQIKEDHDG